MRDFTFRFLLIALGFIFNIHVSKAQPGLLDPTFANGGKLIVDFLGQSDEAKDVAIQPDGKILIAGSSNQNFIHKFALIRLNSDGTPDASFSNDGNVDIQIGTNNLSTLECMLLQPDGKIILAGQTYNGTYFQIALVRFTNSGILDSTFSNDGIFTYSPNASVGCNAIALDANGSIVVAGSSSFLGNGSDVSLFRVNSNGTLDLGFGGGDGHLETGVGAVSSALDVVIQSDGKIVVAGLTGDGTYNDFLVARYNSGGFIDNTFDTDGIKTFSLAEYDDYATSILQLASGKLLIGGFGATEFTLVRLNSNGAFDNTFGGDGIVLADMNNSSDEIHDLAIDADGKIVVAGHSGYNLYDAAVLRFNANGTIDNLFSMDGKTTVDFSGTYDYSYGVAIQADGKIVVVGSTDNGGQNDFAIFRLQGVCPAISFSQEVSICTGESIVVDGHQYTTAGVYNDQITLATGCDSSITTILNVLPHSSFTQDVTINAGESLSVGNNTYTSSGTYEDVLVAANGCDSLLTTILTVLVGIDDIGLQHELVQVRPVPFEDILIIDGTRNKDVIELTDISGKLIMRVEAKEEQMNLNTSELHAGMYWLIQRNNERLKVRKVMKLN